MSKLQQPEPSVHRLLMEMFNELIPQQILRIKKRGNDLALSPDSHPQTMSFPPPELYTVIVFNLQILCIFLNGIKCKQKAGSTVFSRKYALYLSCK